MKLFRASQSSVVHIEALLTSNQSPVWPAKIFQMFIDTVVCKRLFGTVFHTSVDLSCKKSYKSSSLLRYFNWFLSNHTVGCCNISFSCLSQIRREKFALQAMSLYFCCTFFCVTAVVSMPRLDNFSPCDPQFFCFSLPLYTHSLLKNEFFFWCSWVIIEKGTEKEKSSG